MEPERNDTRPVRFHGDANRRDPGLRGANPPSGWLIADGRAISRTTCAALFAVIGGYWGAGDGSTTFNLPNMIGRSAIGPGSLLDTSGISVSFAFTQVAGSVWQYITQATLPNYVMATDTQGFHYHGGGTADSGPWNSVSDAQGYHVHGNWTEPANADHTHTGYTDCQGAHQHNVNVTVGGNTSAGGPISQRQQRELANRRARRPSARCPDLRNE